jgi:hypothetical protein
MPRDNLGRSLNFKMADKGAKLALFFGLCWNHPDYPKPIAHLPMELSMFIQEVLWNLKSVSGGWFSNLKFLIMFIGTVVGPLVLLALGGRESKALSETGLAWSFLAIALLLLISLGAGFSMFSRVARFPSIGPSGI